jgi:Peptidase_C39 like family
MDAVRDATVAAAPVIIFDLNGEELFHDYPLVDEAGAVVGTVRAAANRVLGAPLISVSHAAPGWNPGSAQRMALESLHSISPQAAVTSSRLVCYAYPKIGVELTYTVGRKSATQIFDASSGGVVGTDTKDSNQFTRYSLLGTLKAGAAARVKASRAAEAQIAKLPIDVPIRAFSFTQQALVNLSPYCPGSGIGLTHYAQITNYFCVDASAQMLLEHYGWNYTQNQIAVAMSTTAAGGTSGTGLTTGFKSLTDNTLLLTFDDAASRAQQFADAVTEVKANRPLFTQVPHHYRVCVGYSEVISGILGLVTNKMLYIYDPWPWNADLCVPGAPYWETWASSPVMWFGIVHHA